MRSHSDSPLRKKRRLLWVGDSPTVATGFARATQHTLETLQETWDVACLGMHYRGDPNHGFPYDIYPTRWDKYGNYDMLGAKRLPEVCALFRPDVIVLQNDVWNIPYYTKALQAAGITTPVVAALAIDGKNCQARKLDGVALSIFWTEFAQTEARDGGWLGPSAVVPLGIDLEMYKLGDRAHLAPLREHARSRFATVPGSTFDLAGFQKGFVVVNVNRNQQRKRLDLMVQCFCEWAIEHGRDDAFLMIQACPTGEREYDVAQLMDYYGLPDRLFLVYPDKEHGVPERDLVWTYRCADVGMTTTQGEGFGLTTLEMMACGIPQIVPDWAALGELCGDAALKVPCSSFAATQGGANAIGGVIDRAKAIEALDLLYTRPDLRDELSARGLALVRQERYRWPVIGRAFGEAIESALFNPAWDALTEDAIAAHV